MEKRNNWFTDYLEIPGVTKGMRALDSRTQYFQAADFAGASVLDLGCNVGQMSFWAAQQGARAVTGVEYDLAAYHKALAYRKQVPGGERVRFRHDDMDLPTAWHHLPVHDVVMLLSVIDTKELKNRFGILSRACMKTAKVFYLEGHLKQPHTKYINYLLDHTDFTQVRHLGASQGRDLFRCTRDVLDTGQFYAAIQAAVEKYDRVGVVGNQLAGKTTLRKGLGAVALPEGVRVLDDCRDVATLGKPGKMILFDYRAAVYCDDLDVIFHVLSPAEKWESWRPNLGPLRSAKLKEPLGRLHEFRTVLTHGSLDL